MKKVLENGKKKKLPGKKGLDFFFNLCFSSFIFVCGWEASSKCSGFLISARLKIRKPLNVDLHRFSTLRQEPAPNWSLSLRILISNSKSLRSLFVMLCASCYGGSCWYVERSVDGWNAVTCEKQQFGAKV